MPPENVAIEHCREALARMAPNRVVDIATVGGPEPEQAARLTLVGTMSVSYAYLVPSQENGAVLQVIAGETLAKARVLYANSLRVDSLLKLNRDGWRIEPRLHVSSGQSKAWLTPTADLGAYTNYWLAAMQRTRVLKRADWPRFMAELYSRDLASGNDQETFDAAFTRTSKKAGSPAPGLLCAKELTAPVEEPGRLSTEAAAELGQLLRALREPLQTLA